MSTTVELCLIVAMDSARGIGIANRLPWKLAEDMAHFKRTTSGHCVIMGRKTYESIGRALPQRRNIVVSRNPAWSASGVECAPSLPAALDMAGEAGQVFVIGGAQLYAAALPLANRLIATEIDKPFECDAFFPTLPANEWQEVARETHFSEQNDCSFSFVQYLRIASAHI